MIAHLDKNGYFFILDRTNGQLIRVFPFGGRQYIAVPSGWGGWVEGFVPGTLGAPHGAALFGFALPESRRSLGPPYSIWRAKTAHAIWRDPPARPPRRR